MKKNIILVGLLFLILSCNKSEIKDLNNNVKILQDSLQASNKGYYALLDSIINIQNSIKNSDTIDIKAMKMEAIGSLFENVARQPEAYKSMIGATKMLYKDYHDLLPLSDKSIFLRGRARGSAFGQMFAAIARQPEASQILDSIAELFLGPYNSSIISDELLDYTKSFAAKYVIESIARQPEMDSVYNVLSIKYLNCKINP